MNIVMNYLNDSGSYEPLYPQTQGTLAGLTTANSISVATLSSTQIRNIYAGTVDMTDGSSALASGDIYLCYEA